MAGNVKSSKDKLNTVVSMPPDDVIPPPIPMQRTSNATSRSQELSASNASLDGPEEIDYSQDDDEHEPMDAAALKA